ncbi:MAG: hypothetical protein JWM63_4028 [Gammaproteobacteria bacterium]|nr:hypothetical protein [Gammaproteobacteria bacterium]
MRGAGRCGTAWNRGLVPAEGFEPRPPDYKTERAKLVRPQRLAVKSKSSKQGRKANFAALIRRAVLRSAQKSHPKVVANAPRMS